MTYTLALTEWPSFPISEAVKQVIGNLFSTLDDTGTGAGDRLADEIFTTDGFFDSGAHGAKGTEELRRCRDNAWKVILKRRHEILKVYVAEGKAVDLLLLGKVGAELQNGKVLTSDFAARLVFDIADVGRPKVKLYQTFIDTAPLLKAVQAQ